MPIYVCNCFAIEGIGNLEIALIFSFAGRMPSLVFKWLKKFNSVFPDSDLVALITVPYRADQAV